MAASQPIEPSGLPAPLVLWARVGESPNLVAVLSRGTGRPWWQGCRRYQQPLPHRGGSCAAAAAPPRSPAATAASLYLRGRAVKSQD